MGGSGSMRRWVQAGLAQGDYLHFAAAGYRLWGAAMYKELLDHYQIFVTVREEPRKPASVVVNKAGETK